MATPVQILNLGFSGVALIDNQQVLVTSGSVSKQQNVVYLNPVSIPHPDGISGAETRTRVKYTDGTFSISGNIAFDLTSPALRLLKVGGGNNSGSAGLLKRGKMFTVDFFGGNQSLDAYRCSGCYVTSLTANGSVGGLINCNLSFVAKQMQQIEPVLLKLDGQPSYGAFIRDENNIPLGYWYSGQTTGGSLTANIQDWSLEYSQEATPVFLNGWTEENAGSEGGDEINDDMFPQYIRIGQVTYNLSATTLGGLYPTDDEGNVRVDISTTAFTIQTTMNSFTYNLAQANGLSTFSHSFEGYAKMEDGSGGFVII